MIFAVLITTIFLILRLPSLFEPYWYGDEGIYLTIGQAVQKGVTLYSRIHDNKPPTLYYLASIGLTVFGFRLLLLLWMIPTVYVFFKLCRHFFDLKISQILTLVFVVITSIPVVEGHIANAEIFMLLPTILAFYWILNRPLTNLWLFVSGLLLGFAFTIKVPVAIEFGLICLWIIYQTLFARSKNIKNIFYHLVSLTFGFFLPIFIYFIYFFFKGASASFLYSALLQNFGYLSSWTTGSHSGSASQGGLSQRLLILLLYWLFLGVLSLKKIINPQFLFIASWLGATTFGALLSERPYPHYLIQTIPPLILAAGLAISQQIIPRLINLSIIICFVAIVLAGKFYTYPVLSYYSNFYQYVLSRKSASDYRSYFGSRVNLNLEISQYIQQHTTPQDKIFVWGDEPYVYALSQRLPSSRYTVAYHILDFNGYQETMDRLKAYLPKYIAIYPMTSRPFPELDDFIDKYYYLDKNFDDVLLFTLRQ